MKLFYTQKCDFLKLVTLNQLKEFIYFQNGFNYTTEHNFIF